MRNLSFFICKLGITLVAGSCRGGQRILYGACLGIINTLLYMCGMGDDLALYPLPSTPAGLVGGSFLDSMFTPSSSLPSRRNSIFQTLLFAFSMDEIIFHQECTFCPCHFFCQSSSLTFLGALFSYWFNEVVSAGPGTLL